MARGQPEVGAESIGQCGAGAKAGGAQPPSESSSHLPGAASGSRSNLGYLTDMHHCTRHFSFPTCNPEFMTRHPQDTSRHDHQSRPQTTLGQEEGTVMGSFLWRLNTAILTVALSLSG